MSLFGFVALYFALQMAPLNKQEELFPDDHPIMTLKATLENEFTETADSQDTLNVVIHWGIKDLDRSEVGPWDSDSAGVLIWDDDFTILPKENQQALLDFCKNLRENADLVFEKRVTCWIEEM